MTANLAMCLLNKRGCKMVYGGTSGFDIWDARILLATYTEVSEVSVKRRRRGLSLRVGVYL